MPVAFERCISAGGKVRTKTLSKNRYMRICYLNGKSYPGEVRKKKIVKNKKKRKVKKK